MVVTLIITQKWLPHKEVDMDSQYGVLSVDIKARLSSFRIGIIMLIYYNCSIVKKHNHSIS